MTETLKTAHWNIPRPPEDICGECAEKILGDEELGVAYVHCEHNVKAAFWKPSKSEWRVESFTYEQYIHAVGLAYQLAGLAETPIKH